MKSGHCESQQQTENTQSGPPGRQRIKIQKGERGREGRMKGIEEKRKPQREMDKRVQERKRE